MILKMFGIKAGCLCLAVVMSGGHICAQQSSDQNEATPAPARAQQTSGAQSSQAQPVPAAAPEAEKTAEEKEKEKEIEKKEQSQRVLGLYPQFSVTSRGMRHR